MLRTAALASLCLLASCDSDDTKRASEALAKAKDGAARGAKRGYAKAEDGVRTGAAKAGDALRKAGDGARRGYTRAKDSVAALDWVEAFDSTRARIGGAAQSLTSPNADEPADAPANAWWKRGAEAVRCEAQVCTVSAWFVTEARANPTRMMGDVKVLTAIDDSGWLLDAVRPGSAAHAMGFRKGDVVRSIAGKPLTDSLARIEILAKLRKADEVDTVFLRVGDTEPSRLTIRFETGS